VGSGAGLIQESVAADMMRLWLIVRCHAVRTHGPHDPPLGFPPEIGCAYRANPAAKMGARTGSAGQWHGVLAAEPHLPNTLEYPRQTLGNPFAIVTSK